MSTLLFFIVLFFKMLIGAVFSIALLYVLGYTLIAVFTIIVTAILMILLIAGQCIFAVKEAFKNGIKF